VFRLPSGSKTPFTCFPSRNSISFSPRLPFRLPLVYRFTHIGALEVNEAQTGRLKWGTKKRLIYTSFTVSFTSQTSSVKMADIKIKGRVLKKVSAVDLCRCSDGVVFHISTPCVLQLPDGLVHVVGEPNEELDTAIWGCQPKVCCEQSSSYLTEDE
jgi:hypothetical protein